MQMRSKILIKSCCAFATVVGDVATEFKWHCLIRNPRVSFSGHVDSEIIQVDETFVDIHAEDDNDNDTDFEYQPASQTRPGTDMDLMTDTENDWASQVFEYLNRRPPRSQQPRFTNPHQLSRQSCFF